MPCDHRFISFLIPKEKNLKFLFIGTFNPSWSAKNGNDAEYFYGRATSLFWCILPHAFNQHCLIDKGKTEWEDFCISNNIGITDFISCITNAHEATDKHKDYLTLGFKDNNIDIKIDGNPLFDLEFTTSQIKILIEENKETLKGVFFTRSTKRGIPRIWAEWTAIDDFCKKSGIYSKTLLTPSVRGGTIREKIDSWKQAINEAIEMKNKNCIPTVFCISM